MFQRILICTDFTDGLGRLVNFVGDFGIAGVKQIVFLHAVPFLESRTMTKVDSEKVAQAQDRFAKALQQVPAEVEVKIAVESGKAVEAILKVAKTYQTQLIIVGTQSKGLLTEKLFGSTLVELSRRTKIPLLVLRPQLISTYRVEELRLRCQHLFQYLLLPYNDSQPAKYMLQQVKHYTQNSSSHVTEQCLLCWIVSEAGRRELSKEHLLQQAQAALSLAKAELEQCNLQVKIDIRQGDPVPEILSVAETEDISAIALTSDASSQRLEWLVSSFAGELLRRSLHPILFFPPA